MDLNFIRNIMPRHFAWIARMGWSFNKTPLEHLALVASEVGEAVNECRGKVPTEKLPFELADICLRVFGLASELNIDLAAAIEGKVAYNEANGIKPGRLK